MSENEEFSLFISDFSVTTEDPLRKYTQGQDFIRGSNYTAQIEIENDMDKVFPGGKFHLRFRKAMGTVGLELGLPSDGIKIPEIEPGEKTEIETDDFLINGYVGQVFLRIQVEKENGERTLVRWMDPSSDPVENVDMPIVVINKHELLITDRIISTFEDESK